MRTVYCLITKIGYYGENTPPKKILQPTESQNLVGGRGWGIFLLKVRRPESGGDSGHVFSAHYECGICGHNSMQIYLWKIWNEGVVDEGNGEGRDKGKRG